MVVKPCFVQVLHEWGTFSSQCKQLGTLMLPLHEYKDIWKAMVHGQTAQARWFPLDKPQQS
jgi:hypothetical protein